MRRFLTTIMAVSAISFFTSCEKDNGGNTNGEGKPSIEWASNPEFATVNIDNDLDATMIVKAPAGIKTFIVEVDSDELAASLNMMGITTTSLDLINDKTVIGILAMVTDNALPTGDALLGKTEVTFSLTTLVKMIPILAENGTEHTFTLSLSDNDGNSLTQKCTFKVVK